MFKRLLWLLYYKELRQILLKIFLVSFYLCVCVFSLANMSVYHMYPWYPQRSEDSIEFLGTGVMDGFEPPYGYWELNLDIL